MNNNDMNDREMERLLGEHFASGTANVPPTPDLWGVLESRLGAQGPKPLWAVLRDIGTPVDGFRFAPALAATAAVAVVAVAGGFGVVRGRQQQWRWSARGGTGGGDTNAVARDGRLAQASRGWLDRQARKSQTAQQGLQARRAYRAFPDVDGDQYRAGRTPTPMPWGMVSVSTPTPEAMTEKSPTPPPAAAEYRITGPTATPAPSLLVPGGPSDAPPGLPDQRSLGQPGATTFQDYERQPLTEAREDNVSTFSLDTDRTSFQLALNWARAGLQGRALRRCGRKSG